MGTRLGKEDTLRNDPMRVWVLLTIVALLVGGCAPSAAPGQAGPSSGGTMAGPPRVVAAILSDPPSLYPALNPSSIRGGEAIEELANSGLAVVDNRGSLRPRLAQEVPSVENGLWRILPDGRAETTWKIREGVQWHDGAPFNGEDLVFTIRVLQDRELAMLSHQAFGFVERVEARDPQTVTVEWKQPYIDADRMFTRGLASPLPRHLLEGPYQQEKERFLGLPY